MTHDALSSSHRVREAVIIKEKHIPDVTQRVDHACQPTLYQPIEQARGEGRVSQSRITPFDIQEPGLLESRKMKLWDVFKRGVIRSGSNDFYPKRPSDLKGKSRKLVAHPFLEEEPTVREWLETCVPTRNDLGQYISNLFPSLGWIPRYNSDWMLGDAIAGLTVGIVVIPQAMAYALLAGLTPEYGLYTSFTGAVVYWMFGTSKDIVIGTTAIGSLLVGEVVATVEEAKNGLYSHEEAAKTLSLLAGSVLLVCGFLRLGWLIEFIPYVPISAFVTSASITIMTTQFPVVLGITDINKRDSPYHVILNTFRGLGRIQTDAYIGLSSIVLLFFLKSVFDRLETRQPERKRMWATLSSLRMTFTMILFTMISQMAHYGLPEDQTRFRIVGKIENGFKHAGIPNLDPDLIGTVLPQLPAIVMILIIEHIAIAKSFGRKFGYTVITSQEMCAQGCANIFSPFVGGYVCTGSFTASAVVSKSGVRTPLAGLFSAFILVLALYVLPSVFYYIPMAALAGLIIHAVSNLATPPKTLYKYWKLSPFELFIWTAGVVSAFFSTLETSIYSTVGLSFLLLLVRHAQAQGQFLGQVQVYEVSSDTMNGATGQQNQHDPHPESLGLNSPRDTYLPIDSTTGLSPDVRVQSPYPGVFIYRFTEGFDYINQAQNIDHLLSYITANTRHAKVYDDFDSQARLWCDPPLSNHSDYNAIALPALQAVVLDFSSVNNIDITSIQGLISARNTLDQHAADTIPWHFAGVYNRWTRRALALAGFGYPTVDEVDSWEPSYTLAAPPIPAEENKYSPISPRTVRSEEENSGVGDLEGLRPIYGTNRPFFHPDLVAAVRAAVHGAKRRDGLPTSGISWLPT
ncbi:sulfate permease [Microthyrium microscopicum]|uniref:Sulfate permease n=1 Tax=Microthyrium microscopicum TaxID=703497 RepID=A0A6A6UB85_9PEZI|nr:sulfate permease [Microthyrium microscopicum]